MTPFETSRSQMRGTGLSRSIASLTALGLAALALTTGAARAQGSDACGTAQNIGNAFGSFAYDTGVATTGAEGQAEAACLFFGSTAIDKDVWYTWTAPVGGSVTLTICGGVSGGSADTKVAVYNGAGCPAAATIACNDDSCGLTSQLSFTAVGGNSYTIQLGAFPGEAGGTGSFTLSGPPVGPANDNCATATNLGNAFGAFPVSTVAATGSTPAAGPGCTNVNDDVFYTWQAPVSGTVVVSLCAGGIVADTALAIFDTSTCPPATLLGCNDDFCGAQSQASFTAVSGNTYLIVCGSFGTTDYTGTMTISGPPVPPANDDCLTPTAIAGTGLFPFNNTNATTGAQGQAEAACLFFGQIGNTRDVWFTWTAPATPGIATVETCAQTTVDTKIAVYDGAGCPSAATIACNDDACSLQSRVRFGFVAGGTYTIQLGTFPGASGGAGNLNITVGPPQVKISQFYGGGGNQGAPVLSDFVELYNAGPVSQPLTGWSVQYNSAAGTGTWQVTNLAGSIAPGRFYLVKQADGTTNGPGNSTALPTPDATGTIAMAAGDARVALCTSTTNLGTGNPPASTAAIADLVGMGATAIFREPMVGGALHNNAPIGSSNNSVYRLNCGNTDSDVNSADFTVGWVAPRNSALPATSGITAIGTAYPWLAEELQTVRLVCTPYACATLLPSTATVTVDTTLLGGGPGVAMVDDGTSGDQLAGDGIYSVNVTLGAGLATGTKNMPVLVINGAQSGSTYISVEVRPLATPDNDNCQTAIALSGPFPQQGSSNLLGASAEWNVFQLGGTAPAGFQNVPASRGVWFSFTGTGNTMTVTTCDSPLNGAVPPAIPDTRMNVFGGACENLTWVAGNDDTTPLCGVGTGTERRSRVAFCTVMGATYYVLVVPFSAVTVSTPIVCTVTDGGLPACTGAVPMDSCPPPTSIGAVLENEAGFGAENNFGCDALILTPLTESANHRFKTVAPSFPAQVVTGTARGFHSNRDVDWYRFQAPSTGLFSVSMTAQFLGVFSINQLSATGTCTTNTALAGSAVSNRCGTVTASAVLTAGNWYGVRVVPINTGLGALFGGVAPGANAYHYSLSLEFGAPLANDNCATASVLTIGTATAGLTIGATNDGTSACDPTGRDVWYQFTLASAASVVVDTIGSPIDTVVSVHPACGAADLGCNDDIAACFGTGTVSAVGPLSLAAGTYFVRVSDKNIGIGGAFNVRVRTSGYNDNCCGAIAVGIPSATAGTTVGATLDAPVPPVCDGPGVADRGGNTAVTAASVWYTVVSPVNQTVYADVLNASHDSKLSVYSGSCGVFTCVTMNDDINAAFKSKVAWQATAGQTYYVMVHGFGTGTGTFTLNVLAEPTPANDLCGSAAVVTGTSGSTGGTLAGATGDNNTITSSTLATCATQNTYWDVWYSWTAACVEPVTFTTCGAWDTILSVHTTCPTTTAGNMLAGACNDNGAGVCAPGSEVTFTPTVGTTYLVRVATAGAQAAAAGGGQAFTLTWSQTLVDTDGDLTPDCFDGCPANPALTAPATFYADADGDGFGAGAPVLNCGGAGFVAVDGDCDDGNIAVNPAATEVCNGIDDDCDTGIDEGVQLTFYADVDGDGFGDPAAPTLACSQPSGFVVDNTDCDDTNMNVNPGATEVCNGIDDDCDVLVDEGVLLTFFADADGDGFGDAGVTTQACSAPSGFVANSGDCNDANAAINPAAAEVCDGQDNDCDTAVDEGFDADGDSVVDCFDNCPAIANPTQGDLDGDLVGDACDNCPATVNPSQADCDADNVGDACEGEPDCNLNNIPDSCDIAGGGSTDLNANSVPDECEGLVAYCFGDSSANGGPDCPCGNNVAIGVQRGCVNSTGNGALLGGVGPTSLSGDGLTLLSSAMPATTSALFIQGTSAAGGGFGTVPFNDGLQCVDGALLRIGTRTASGGVAGLGFPGTPISILGGVGVPGQRFYQVVYRNNAGPCNFLSNSTNGLRVIWTP